jgi:hypothetical protein
MAFREIKKFAPANENLFEPEHPIENIRADTQSNTFLRLRGFLHHPLALLSFHVAVELGVAAVLVFFGVMLGGSYYGPASGRFTGMLATIFYVWQVATIMTILGMIVAYDAVKKLF